MNRTLAALTSLGLLLASDVAAAHEGHGPSNPHLHASDLFGLMLAVGVAAAGIAWWRGRK